MSWKWLFAVGVAWGCTCSAPLPPCELFGRSRAVFSGVVLDTNEDGRGGLSRSTFYLVRVEEGFRGLAPEQKEVFIDPGSFTSCYTYFEVGKKYLFYGWGLGGIASISFTGRRGEEVALPPQWQEKKDLKVYSVPMCSGSKEWENAQEDVDWIRRRLREETSTRVYGQTVQSAKVHWDGVAVVPLAGAKVFLRNGDAMQTVVSGADGRFAFEGIAPGKYGLHAELAPWEGSYRADLTVAERGCAERMLPLVSHGEVRGVVRNRAGRPIAGVDVELMRVLARGDLARRATITESTDRDGAFRMRNVPAGEFVVGVNAESALHLESRWPTTFYPGVGALRRARVLRLAPNGIVEGISFALPNPLLTRTVTVRVLWADGSEVGRGANVSAERIEPLLGAYRSGHVNDQSEVRLQVTQGVAYKMQASTYGRGLRTIGADPVTLPAGSEPVTLEIRLRENRPSQ